MIIRIITGAVLTIASLWFVVFIGLIDGPGIDYLAILFGSVFFIIGLVIIFNKKEDEIEKIKKSKK